MLQNLGSNLYINSTMVEGLSGENLILTCSGDSRGLGTQGINRHSFSKVCALVLELYL